MAGTANRDAMEHNMKNYIPAAVVKLLYFRDEPFIDTRSTAWTRRILEVRRQLRSAKGAKEVKSMLRERMDDGLFDDTDYEQAKEIVGMIDDIIAMHRSDRTALNAAKKSKAASKTAPSKSARSGTGVQMRIPKAVTTGDARYRWARTSEYTRPKGRTLYAVYVDGDRYDMSRGEVYIDIVGGSCYTDRDKAIRHAWWILDDNWEDLVENRPYDSFGEYPVSVVEIYEDRARSPDAYNRDPEWYEGRWTHLKYGEEPWNTGSKSRRSGSSKERPRSPKGRFLKGKGSGR